MYQCYACGKEIEHPGESCPYCRFPVISTLHGDQEEVEKIREFAEEYRKTNPQFFTEIKQEKTAEKTVNEVQKIKPPAGTAPVKSEAQKPDPLSQQRKLRNLELIRQEQEKKRREEADRVIREAAERAAKKKKKVRKTLAVLLTVLLLSALGAAAVWLLPKLTEKSGSAAVRTEKAGGTNVTENTGQVKTDASDEAETEDAESAEGTSETEKAAEETKENAVKSGAKTVTSVLGGKKGGSQKESEKETETDSDAAETDTVKEDEETIQTAALPSAEVGERIRFGHYEQDNDIENGQEEILWRVLEKDGDRLLLISEYALDCQLYEFTSEDTKTWETCTIRSWLNEDFLKTAFTEAEISKILVSTVNPDRDSYTFILNGKSYTMEACGPTEDRVFLISYRQAESCFSSDEDRRCEATAYALKQGARNYDGYCKYYYNSPYQNLTGWISNDGHIAYPTDAGTVFNEDAAIRPALWVSTAP